MILVTNPEGILIGAAESDTAAEQLVFEYAYAYALRNIGNGLPEEIVDQFIALTKDARARTSLKHVLEYASDGFPELAKALRTFSSGCKLEKIE